MFNPCDALHQPIIASLSCKRWDAPDEPNRVSGPNAVEIYLQRMVQIQNPQPGSVGAQREFLAKASKIGILVYNRRGRGGHHINQRDRAILLSAAPVRVSP